MQLCKKNIWINEFRVARVFSYAK